MASVEDLHGHGSLVSSPSIVVYSCGVLKRFKVLQGLLTVVAGVLSLWIIQDFPDTAKFLTEEERTLVIRRLQQDAQFSAAGETFKFKYLVKSLKDWKTWVGSEIWCSCVNSTN